MIENENIEEQHEEKLIQEGGSKLSLENIEPLISNSIYIRKDVVIKQILKYINNLYSQEYKDYIKTIELLYSKAGKKNKIIRNGNNIYLVSSSNPEGDFSKYSMKITKPIYSNIDELLIKTRNLVSSLKLDVETKHFKLQSEHPNSIIPTEQTKDFETLKNKYSIILEEYECYRVYNILVKNLEGITINPQSYTSVILQNIIKTTSEQERGFNDILFGKSYIIPLETITQINKHNAEHSIQYQSIIEKLKNNTRDSKKQDNIKDEIKAYLEDKNEKIIKDTLETIKTKQNTKIDYIIVKMPIIEVK
jgi:hypothetical protein